jgi:hypothetical protein
VARRSSYGRFTYRPHGSSRYWFRFQYPKDVQALLGKRKVEYALQDPETGERTSDPKIADTLALAELYRHRLLVQEARNRLGTREVMENEDGSIEARIVRRMKVAGFDRPYPLGQSTTDDGTRVIAAEDSAVLIGDGVLQEVPNALRPILTYAFFPGDDDRRAAAPVLRRDDDFAIFERHIAKAKLRKDDASALLRTVEDLKSLTEGRPFRDLKRSEVEALITYLREERSLSSGRVKKLLAYMRASMNRELVQDEPLITRNVFDRFEIEDPDEEGEIPPYSDQDMAIITASVDNFDPESRLMLIWALASGIRPIGIYSIQHLEVEERQGHRTPFVFVHRDKGKYGRRALPIPAAVLECGLLPAKWDGPLEVPLFSTPLPQLLVRVNGRLSKIGVNVGTKTLYSARHRARDRLRDIQPDVPDQMSRAILGHSRQGVHERYGHNYSMWRLKPIVDQIGVGL